MKRFQITRTWVLALAVVLDGSAAADGSALGSAQPGRIDLTIDWQADQNFAVRVSAELAALQQRLDGRLCHAVSGVPLVNRPAFCSSEARPAAVHVAVLRDSAFWRSYSTHPAALERPFPIGSVAKAVIAVPLLAKADARPDETWCVQALPGLRNADGSTGAPGCNIRISALQAIASSNNLATIWRLQQIEPARLRQSLSEAQIRGVPADVQPAVAATLGIAQVSPRQVLECFDALARSGEARRAVITRHAGAAPTPMATWCAGAVETGAQRALVRALLSAPAESGGTAAFLPSLLTGASGWRAKTGTPTDDVGYDTAKLLVFSVVHRQRVYTGLIAISSPLPSWPLAASISSAELKGLAKVVAAEIAESAAPRSSPSQPATARNKL
jgi:hypothetical protein